MNIELTVYQKNKIFWPFPLTTALVRLLQNFFDFEFEFNHRYDGEDQTYLSMSVYSTLDDDRYDVNRTEIVEEYLIKMANFIAFYRVPNFEELDFKIPECFSISKPLLSSLGLKTVLIE